MEETTYLIIGGGVAGTTAAESIRRKDPGGSITIVSDEPYRLYSRIMLSKPNYFLGKIPEKQIWLKTDEWYKEKNINLLKGKKCTELDIQNNTVSLDDGSSIKYSKLLLAIGGCARRLTLPGSDKKGIYVLRTLDEARAIINAVKTAKQAVVIGGGFVGFEMCDMLKLAGIDVTMLIREPYFWSNMLDEASGKMIEKALEKGGVKILRNEEATEITGGENVEGVKLKSNGKILPCQIVVAGIGLVCPIEPFSKSGINIDRVFVSNEYMETSVKNVWAAGDSNKFRDVVIDEEIQLGNWINAQMQGKIAGINMAGGREIFKMVSFYTTTGFGTTIAFVGNIRVDTGKEVVARGPQDNTYVRIILKGSHITGATILNKTPELAIISKLIEKKADVSNNKNNLADPNFDLKTLLPK